MTTGRGAERRSYWERVVFAIENIPTTIITRCSCYSVHQSHYEYYTSIQMRARMNAYAVAGFLVVEIESEMSKATQKAKGK